MQKFQFLKTTVFPAVKVRLMVLWWSIKYGGRKNIPPQLLFSQMEKSFLRMKENLDKAMKSIPNDISDKEMKDLQNLLSQAGDIEKAIEQARMRKDIFNGRKN